jgi:hypothetical protein
MIETTIFVEHDEAKTDENYMLPSGIGVAKNGSPISAIRQFFDSAEYEVQRQKSRHIYIYECHDDDKEEDFDIDDYNFAVRRQEHTNVRKFFDSAEYEVNRQRSSCIIESEFMSIV